MKILSVAILSMLILTISSSCKKKPSTPAKSKTVLLSQGSWRFKSATANGSDASGSLQACQKDNIYIFLAAGTGNVDEGPTKCNSGDLQITPLTWSFASNETILNISLTLFSNTSNNFSVISLTETELIVSTFYTPPVGPAILIIITFSH